MFKVGDKVIFSKKGFTGDIIQDCSTVIAVREGVAACAVKDTFRYASVWRFDAETGMDISGKGVAKIEMAGKYTKCEKCGEFAVHLAMANSITFTGDADDNNGDQSEWDGEDRQTDVCVGVHICFECGELEDVFIEYPESEK
jgi:hypothetical protein